MTTDKPMTWSPRGTYLILIKSDKVEFLGGKDMQPILAIEEAKVDSVLFSPCERYILLYTPLKDMPYQIWNFTELTLIRDFPEVNDDKFKWSFSGDYIARRTTKKFKPDGSALKPEEEEEIKEEEIKEKTFVTVYEMPDCTLIQDQYGDKTSIYVEGLKDFSWAPHKNVITHASFPEGENAYPRVIMQAIPSRQELKVHTLKDSKDL